MGIYGLFALEEGVGDAVKCWVFE